MGQYYYPMLERKHRLSAYYSHNYGNGLKLTEHAYVNNNFTETVLKQLYKHPAKLAWVGDYAEESDFDNYDFGERCVRRANQNKYSHPKEINEFSKDKIILNHTEQAYIDMKEYCEQGARDSCGFLLHPLPILTAVGNGRGGGDYYGPNSEIAGIWAGDLIEIVDKNTTDYENITVDLIMLKD